MVSRMLLMSFKFPGSLDRLKNDIRPIFMIFHHQLVSSEAQLKKTAVSDKLQIWSTCSYVMSDVNGRQDR